MIYTMTLLRHNDRYLLLKRSSTKGFAPGKWTGVGGRVEDTEFKDLYAAAYREIEEETGISHDQITNLAMRRLLIHNREATGPTLLIYLTGDLSDPAVLETEEGLLHWIAPEEFEQIEFIDNAHLVIPLLVSDMKSPRSRPITGAAHYSMEGELRSLCWSS